MGKWLVGNTKDSVVKSYIKNTGTYQCRIDSVTITGTDASQFVVINNVFPYILPAGTGTDVEFLFKPTSVGVKNANVNIYTQANKLIQKITEKEFNPVYQ